MKQEIELSEFQQWIENAPEVTYASSFGKINKKLTATIFGGFKVYHNDKCVHEGMQPFSAVEAYNNIV